MDSSNKRIVRNAVFLYGRMILTMGLTLISARLVLKALGVVDYGIYNVVSGFVSMFAFLNTAMANGIQRFYNYEIGKNTETGAQTIFSNAVRIQIAIAVIIFGLLESIGLWYINAVMVIPAERVLVANVLFQCSIFSTLLVVLQIPYSSAIMAYEKMDYYAVVSVFGAVINLLLVYVLTKIHGYDKLLLYGFLFTTVHVVIFLLYFIYCQIKFKNLKYSSKSKNKEQLREMMSFSGWNLFGSFSSVMQGQGVNMILNLFFGPVVNAARGISNQVASAIQSLIANNSIAVKPQMTKSYAHGDIKRTMRLMYGMSKLNFIFLLLLSLPICLEIHCILGLWLGDNIPEYTSIFTVWIVLTSFINNFNAPVSFVVHASGKMKHYQIWSSLILLMVIPCTYIVLKHGYDPVSAFIVTFVFTLVSHLVSLFILKTIVTFSVIDYCKKVVMPCLLLAIPSVGLSAIPVILMNESFVRLVITGLVSIMMVTIFSYLIGADSNEKKTIRTFVLKKISNK